MASPVPFIPAGLKSFLNFLKLNSKRGGGGGGGGGGGLQGPFSALLPFSKTRGVRRRTYGCKKNRTTYYDPFLAFKALPEQKAVTLTYLLLPLPLTFLLTPAACQDLLSNCGPCPQGQPPASSVITCPCVECSPSPPPPTSPPCPPPPCPPVQPEPKPCTSSDSEPQKPPPSPPTTKIESGVRWSEPDELSHQVLVRQACQLTVDSVTRIIGETIAAYQDYHNEYRSLLDCTMEALEFLRSAHGTHAEVIDCKLIMIRARVEEMKASIVELESFMCSIQKLAEAAGETAYLGHAEYHGICMCERMQSAMKEMTQIREESLRKERDMIELQSVVIVESGKCLK